MTQQLFFWISLAYLVGAIPMGYMLGRLRGIDLRDIGSGNIGATNAVRAMGKKWGLVVFFLDVLKAWLPVFLASQEIFLGGKPNSASFIALTGAAAFLGHIFPVYLRFRGGKGVAVALGVALVFSPSVALIALILYLQTLFLSRISALSSLTAVTSMALIVITTENSAAFKLLILFFTLLIFWRHRGNIHELLANQKNQKTANP